MNKMTLLEENQVTGDNQLEIFKKMGKKAAVTDHAILTGAYVSDSYHVDDDSSLKGRCGFWWTKTPHGEDGARVVDDCGISDWYTVNIRNSGVRPALPYSSISEISPNGVRSTNKKGVEEVKVGNYPRWAVNKEKQELLFEKLNSGALHETNIPNTSDLAKTDAYGEKINLGRNKIYEYNGKLYALVKANSYSEKFTLSNGIEYKRGDLVWEELEPIIMYNDKQAKMLVPKEIILGGIPFKHDKNYHGNFEETDMYKYMNEHLLNEIMYGVSLEKERVSESHGIERKTRLDMLNPDTTSKSERRKMTYSELLYNFVNNGESVLLRGPSGIGKTERIRMLFPNAIFLKLTNNMFPEKVVGSINLQTGESIPPDYAKLIISMCSTEEEKKLVKESIQNIYDVADKVYERSKIEDEKIPLVLDELLNVNEVIQTLVYTLVLNRLVEIGKGINLPKNTVIVATGNRKKDSSAAYDIVGPLEKRFDHIIDVEPRVGEWIYDYAIPNQIHPTVIGYILSKYQGSGNSEELEEIGYFYEEPEVGERNLDKYGCKGRTNDPRGWVSVSTSLYNFERNLKEGKYIGKDVENILEETIGTKLREEWAREFYQYYNMPTLTVEEVVNKEYDQGDLPRDINEKYAYTAALLTANEEQVKEVREFIEEYCGREYQANYDLYWVGNDELKAEKLMEIEEAKGVRR